MNRGALTDVLKKLAYGFYIVTVKEGERYAAGAVNWFSQASFKPPLIMAAIKKDTQLGVSIDKQKKFGINLVSSAQAHILPSFFKSTEEKDGKINGLAFTEGENGSPIFVDCPASLECEVIDSVDKGDHYIFIAKITNAGVRYEDQEILTDKETPYSYGA